MRMRRIMEEVFLKISSIVLKALSDSQVRAWVYRKSKYNYYENVQYCSE